MRRRELLKYGAGATAGVVAAGLGGILDGAGAAGGAQAGHAGHAVPGDLTDVLVPEFTRKGKTLKVIGDKKSKVAKLFVNSKEMPHFVFMQDGELFHSHMLPFTEYADPKVLCTALADGDSQRLFVL